MQYFPLPLLKAMLREQFCFRPQKKNTNLRICGCPVRRKAKKQKKEISMYKENQNKLINIVDDGDIIHVFITAPSKKKDEVEDALKSSFKELSKIYGGSIIDEFDYDDEQFYFTLDSFEEYDDFKHIFYKEYCNFDLSKRELEDRYNEDRF